MNRRGSRVNADPKAKLCDWAWQQAIIEGVYAFADRIDVDGSNLSKAIKSRKFSAGMLGKLRTASDTL